MKLLKLTIISLFVSLSINAKTLQLVSIQNLAEQEVGRIVIADIYKRLNIDVEISPVPGKRAQVEVQSGRKDGEIMRIKEYGDAVSNVVRVETPYYKLETMAFKRANEDIKIEKALDLKKYRVVVVRGVKHTELITKGLESVYRVKTTDQMMKFLKAKRADIALTNTIDGELYIKKNKAIEIEKAGPPLASFDLYHYLLLKHKDLANRINTYLKKIKRSGQLQEIIKNAEKSVLTK